MFMKKIILSIFVIISAMVPIVNATDTFGDYDSSFDTSSDIYLEYNYTPQMNSTELDEWVHSQGSNCSWAYTIYQSGADTGFRFETGYWIWKDNTSKYTVKLYGNTSKGDVSVVSVVFPFLEMQENKTYTVGIALNGSQMELFVNGEKYNASGYMQIKYKNGTYNGWVPFKNGNISLGNFSLKDGKHGLKYNITGWDSQHLGSYPFTNVTINNATEYNPLGNHAQPVRTPIPLGAIIISTMVIVVSIMKRDD
jgi:hypothetical protein